MTNTDHRGAGDATTKTERPVELDSLVAAIEELATSRDPALAGTLSKFFAAVATEASKGSRFANALKRALEPSVAAPDNTARRRAHRRSPAALDPFAVYAERQESGLRDDLTALTVDQLKDIVAEYAMDNDRLAMKWKEPQRIIDRIVDRVTSRASKGSAFK